MKILYAYINEKSRIAILSFKFIIFFFLFFYLLIYFCFTIYSLIRFKKLIVKSFREFTRNYYLLLFLGLLVFVPFLLSNKIYLTVFKDVLNIFILMSVFFMASLVITSKKELNYFVSNQVYLIVLFAFAISILGLLDLLNIFSYNSFLPVN